MDIKKLVSDLEENASLVALEKRMRLVEKEMTDIRGRLDASAEAITAARDQAEQLEDSPEKVAELARLEARGLAVAESLKAWSARFAPAAVAAVVRED